MVELGWNIKLTDKLITKVRAVPSPQLLAWLEHRYSLTQKLKDVAGHTRLEILVQRWDCADIWDSKALGLDVSTVLHREILMWSGHNMCWYAKSIIPQDTYKAELGLFKRLEFEPLGALIFNNNKIKRTSLIHYAIDQHSMEYDFVNQAMRANAKILWVRLSRFMFAQDLPFFLIEILLPGLNGYCN